ncbi:uncharacterized protein BcabD6B2_24110 [Babesia caballi]|uniref:Membrane protein, putative n=1 Tax=Babesia caballi TaxID=5871 RepID=A0AAV4LSZ6_BABCB|nr:membrane protein, putative [Babesia caballi]
MRQRLGGCCQSHMYYFSPVPHLVLPPHIASWANHFAVIYLENTGLYEIKCNAKEDMHVDDAFGLCREDFAASNLNAHKTGYKNELTAAFKSYCPQFFSSNEPCVLFINKSSSGADRFRVGQDLKCKDGVVFVGLYHCCDKEETPIASGELVSLYSSKVTPLSPVCPEDKKIFVVNSGQRGSVMCDKGHVSSTVARVSEACNGKQSCTVNFDSTELVDCSGFSATHFIKYNCV